MKLSRNMSRIFAVLCGVLSFSLLRAADDAPAPVLHPSFPDYAAATPPPSPVGPRDGPSGAVPLNDPFSWNQILVVRPGSFNYVVVGFDPGAQPIFINMTPLSDVVTIDRFDPNTGLLQFTVPENTTPQIVTYSFQVTARGITNPATYTLSIDIRARNTRVRGTPFVNQSFGADIQPGQIVRYTWTQTGRGEKKPKCEVRTTGVTSTATGLFSSSITGIQTVKFRPTVLGYYYTIVTPRDVPGEPARGTNSVGRVFRCAFGSNNLAPVTDGMSSDAFTPAVGQKITLQPNAVDPETGQSAFANEIYDFGDGTVVTGISSSANHTYALPGIYAVRCTVADGAGATAVAQDNIIVGATVVPTLKFSFNKKIIPIEAGIGDEKADTLNVTFSNITARAGDRIVFVYNRNRFGRMFASDGGDDTDIIIKGGGFTGKTRQAKNLSVKVTASGISIKILAGQFDRTGDPRLGRADLKGIFKNQRIGICVVPGNGTTPIAQVYTGNIKVTVKGGEVNATNFVPEESVSGKSTTKEPNPKTQEIP